MFRFCPVESCSGPRPYSSPSLCCILIHRVGPRPGSEVSRRQASPGGFLTLHACVDNDGAAAWPFVAQPESGWDCRRHDATSSIIISASSPAQQNKDPSVHPTPLAALSSAPCSPAQGIESLVRTLKSGLGQEIAGAGQQDRMVSAG